MDIAPVILELAGVPVPDSWETVSLMPALQGTATEGARQYVFAEHKRDDVLTGTEMMTMVRSRDGKLVHYVDDAYGELYDMRNDPGERVNLWNDPACREQREGLLAALRDGLIRSNIKTASWTEPWQ
jgi:arylsulfatase